jgi:hypothetical protein
MIRMLSSSKKILKVNRSKGGSLKDFIDGSVLTRDFVLKQLPFIIFLAILAIFI